MERQQRISGALIAAAAGLGVMAPLVLAGTASAHVPAWTVSCDSITIDLKYYSDHADVTNTVELKVDGKDVIPSTKFLGGYQKTVKLAAHDKPVSAELIVFTSDDPQGQQKPPWSVDWTKDVPVCESPSPSPSPSPSSPSPSASPSQSSLAPSKSQTPSASPSTSPSSAAPTTHQPAPSASPTGPQLASTGGGGNAGLIAGAGIAVVAVGGGVLYLTRRRPGRH